MQMENDLDPNNTARVKIIETVMKLDVVLVLLVQVLVTLALFSHCYSKYRFTEET